MPYKIIQPPFTLQFREMSKKELKAYFDWFLAQIPGRVAELEAEVRTLYNDWSADRSPQSLVLLGEWFAGQVETRKRTSEEMAKIRSSLSFPIEVPEFELTNRTFSLALDIGMYLALTLKAQYPHLNWNLPLSNKRYADYGQPVLVGFGPVELNPVSLLVTLAYGIAGKKKDGRRLKELHDYWAEQTSSITLKNKKS